MEARDVVKKRPVDLLFCIVYNLFTESMTIINIRTGGRSMSKYSKKSFVRQGSKGEKKSAKDKLTEKKVRNLETYKYIKRHLTQKSAKRFRECSLWRLELGDIDMSKLKTIDSNACKNRFCPACAWQKAKKDAMIISAMMQYVENDLKKDFIMLTLTAPSVKGEDLIAELQKYNRGFESLTKRTEVVPVIKGYVRKLEITYNKEQKITSLMWYGNLHQGGKKKPMAAYFSARGLKIGDLNPNYDTYHTHLHVLIAVDKSYFTSRNYIKHERWLQLWQEVMQDPMITQVDVRRIRSKKGSKGLQSSAAEIAKYTAKDGDYNVSQEVFDTFYKALKGRNLLTFGGVFKEAKQKYKAGELDKYIPQDMTEYVWELMLLWGYDPKTKTWSKDRHEYGVKEKRRRDTWESIGQVSDGIHSDWRTETEKPNA